MKEHAQSKTGFLTVLVGPTGSGKTCIAKELFQSADKGCTLDIQEEYTDLNGLQEYGTKPPKKFSMHPAYFTMEEYVRLIGFSKGATFVQEESTGYIDNDFFRTKTGKELIRCIVAKRQIQREYGGGNNFIFIFHSFASIPPKLWPYIDFLFLFKSVERELKVSEPLILKANSEMKEGDLVNFNTWKISDYRLIVRTNHGKNNLEYVQKYLNKRTE